MSGSRTVNSMCICSIVAVLLSFTALMSNYFIIPAVVLVPAIIAKILYENSFSEGIYTSLAIIIFALLGSFVNGINNSVTVLIYCIVITIPGIIIGTSFARKLNFKDILILAGAFELFLSLAAFASLKYIYNIDIASIIRNSIVNSYLNFVEVIEVYNPQLLEALEADKYELFNMFYMILPGLVPFAIIFLAFSLSLIRYILSKILCKHALVLKANFSDGIDKFNISLITNMVCLISVLGLISDINSKITMIALNILLSVLCLYLFDAISLINFKLKQQSPSYIKRIIIFVILLVLAVFTITIFPVINIFYLGIFIGFLDSIFDYRKLKCKEGESDEK